MSSYCSHRDHCVHADLQSDQTLSASGISQLKSNEAIVLVKKQNGAIVLVIKIKPSEALSSLKQYKRTRHSLCLLTINVISNAKEYKRTDGPTCLPVDKLQYIQGEFEGVLPEDLRRRTETQTKFGAQFWRRIISNKIWRMILAQHLTT